MARLKNNKKVLLIEPNYCNKFPPVGLMKLATYYRNLGNWDVVFYKGDLKMFVIENIADKCANELLQSIPNVDWCLHKDLIIEYIKTRKKEILYQLLSNYPDIELLAAHILNNHKDYYWTKEWEKHPEWDRVCVTTLFTFYWDITIETINFAKLLVKKQQDLMVGGVLASIQPNELYEATGIKPHVGILHTAGELDSGDTQIIDELPLDYSILDEIEYKYPMADAFYSYTTRGCIRHCPFCAVPTIEPVYNSYIPLKERIEYTRHLYGDQKDLLLMDNNVLASADFPSIINDIIACGYGVNSPKYKQENKLDISARNLYNGINDRAYIRKTQEIINDFYKKLKGEESYNVFKIIDKYHIGKLATTKKENLLLAYDEIKDLYGKKFRPVPKQRYVDFNQGVDARLFNEENVKLLASITIRPLRIAFDNIKTLKSYEKAIRMSIEAGIKDFSNYLLYNFDDKPEDLYLRLKINVELCEEYNAKNVSIYSFPMKYHPIKGDNSHDRDFIGKYWNRKYIRAIQAILNSTKGKIGKGKTFFYKAFGNTLEEYMELLEMPETFILYRYFFEWLDSKNEFGTEHWRSCWRDCMQTLPSNEKKHLIETIHTNIFTETTENEFSSPQAKHLIKFYTKFRKDVTNPKSELHALKLQFDLENPNPPKHKK